MSAMLNGKAINSIKLLPDGGMSHEFSRGGYFPLATSRNIRMTSRRSFLRSLAAALVLPFVPMLEAANATEFTDTRYWVKNHNAPDLSVGREMKSGEIVLAQCSVIPSKNANGFETRISEGSAFTWKVEWKDVTAWMAINFPLQKGWIRREWNVDVGVDSTDEPNLHFRVVDRQIAKLYSFRHDDGTVGEYVKSMDYSDL